MYFIIHSVSVAAIYCLTMIILWAGSLINNPSLVKGQVHKTRWLTQRTLEQSDVEMAIGSTQSCFGCGLASVGLCILSIVCLIFMTWFGVGCFFYIVSSQLDECKISREWFLLTAICNILFTCFALAMAQPKQVADATESARMEIYEYGRSSPY
jgi:hypothetical protein